MQKTFQHYYAREQPNHFSLKMHSKSIRNQIHKEIVEKQLFKLGGRPEKFLLPFPLVFVDLFYYIESIINSQQSRSYNYYLSFINLDNIFFVAYNSIFQKSVCIVSLYTVKTSKIITKPLDICGKRDFLTIFEPKISEMNWNLLEIDITSVDPRSCLNANLHAN